MTDKASLMTDKENLIKPIGGVIRKEGSFTIYKGSNGKAQVAYLTPGEMARIPGGVREDMIGFHHLKGYEIDKNEMAAITSGRRPASIRTPVQPEKLY